MVILPLKLPNGQYLGQFFWRNKLRKGSGLKVCQAKEVKPKAWKGIETKKNLKNKVKVSIS